MRTVLFITSVLPDRTGAGRAKRAWMWLNLLQKTYQVEILLVQHCPGVPDSYLPGVRLRQINRTATNWLNRLWGVLSAQRSVWSIFVPGWFSLNNMQRSILKSWYATQDFEKIVCFRLNNAELALCLQSVLKTRQAELDIDDIESATWSSISQLYRQNGRYKQGFRTAVIASQYKRLEKKFIKYFEKIHLCSAEDRDLLAHRFPAETIDVLPNKLNRVTYTSMPCIDKSLLFVGSLGYYPNEEAVLWFAKHVLPGLRKTDEQWSFHVVSFDCRQALTGELAEIKGLHLHLNITDIKEAYAQNSVVVSPLHAGGGTKLKIIEAMLYQRPVIATSESVRGLSLRQGVHYLAAETANEFIGKILDLHQNPELYRNLTSKALSYADGKFCYADGNEKTVTLYDKQKPSKVTLQ